MRMKESVHAEVVMFMPPTEGPAMTWQQWVLIAVLVLDAVAVVSMIDVPRPPITRNFALVLLMGYVGLVALVVTG